MSAGSPPMAMAMMMPVMMTVVVVPVVMVPVVMPAPMHELHVAGRGLDGLRHARNRGSLHGRSHYDPGQHRGRGG